MDELHIVTVTLDGPGERLGTMTLIGDDISTDTALARKLLATLRRQSRLSDVDLFGRLKSVGWSNGAIRLEPTE